MKKWSVGIAALSLILWIAGFPPSWVNSWWGILPLILYFASFAAGILGWGLITEKRWGGGRAAVWLYSSLVAVAFAFAMGHLGLLGAPGHWFFLAFMLAGIKFAPWQNARPAIQLFANPWLNFILGFIFFLRFLTAYLPVAHGDPLLYHLMGPRLWTAMGRVQLNTDLPIPLLAATWEYFYLWPQALFTAKSIAVANLILAQIFSQWIHLIFGFFGSVVVFHQLFEKKRWFEAELPRFLLVLALLFVPSMQWTAALAKNDCGMALWCLGAWWFAEQGFRDSRKRDWFQCGLFAGLAVSAKISAIIFLIPLAVLILARFVLRSERLATLPKALGLTLAGSILGAGPIYLRNYLETKNPFYTMFAKWFPGPWVSQSWADHFNTHQPSGGASWFAMMIQRFGQLLQESPMIWLWALLPVLLLKKESRMALAEWADWIALFLLSFVLMFVAVMHDAEMRYFGAALWVAAALGLVFSVIFLQTYLPKFSRFGFVALVIALLGISKLPTHFLGKFYKTSPGEAVVLSHTGGRAKAWLRENAGGKLVVVVGDNETYYLSGVRTAVLTERPDIDAATYKVTDLKEFLRGLCETSGATFLLDVREFASLEKRFPGAPLSGALILTDGPTKIYELKTLQDNILGKDSGCGRN